jgi:spore maturation protein CgeB
LYDTEFRGGKYHLKNQDEFVEKVRYYLNHPGERERIADRWAEDVRMGHTVYARSRYILQSIEKIL